VGDHIIDLADNGFIAQRVTDEQMKRYMDELATVASAKVQIQRKKRTMESDDDSDNDDDLL
jgi:DNA-binding TFAR19-related protein (PDSD5 family)